MSPLEIREVRESDADSIAAHIKTANTPEQIRDQIALFSAKRDEGWEHLVAVDGEAVVGNIAIIPTRYFPPSQPHRAELADIVVAPSHQGSGLLGQLIAAATERAKSRGITQLETSARGSNGRAIAAYRKFGFAEWGRLDNAEKRDDGSYESFVMFRRAL